MYVWSDILLLNNAFENVKKKCFKICELDPVNLLSAPGLAWQVALKKTKVKLDLLIYTYMLLMVEKGIRGGICYSIYWCAKANRKYMKDYDENKEPSYIQHWDVNNLYGWAVPQKLLLNNFEWRYFSV